MAQISSRDCASLQEIGDLLVDDDNIGVGRDGAVDLAADIGTDDAVEVEAAEATGEAPVELVELQATQVEAVEKTGLVDVLEAGELTSEEELVGVEALSLEELGEKLGLELLRHKLLNEVEVELVLNAEEEADVVVLELEVVEVVPVEDVASLQVRGAGLGLSDRGGGDKGGESANDHGGELHFDCFGGLFEGR